MPRTRVDRSQFEIGDAFFGWASPAGSESDAVNVRWSEAGNVLPNGEDYDRDAVYRVAMGLLVEQRSYQA
jgi:hypothetical protein